MSHTYGARLPPRSQGHSKPSSPSGSSALSENQAVDTHATSAKSENIEEKITRVFTNPESNYTGPLNSVLPLPLPDDIDSWSLAQLRTHLEEVVIEMRKATSQTRGDLETQRLSLIERITRTERAQGKKRDAARRVVIGRDVAPPPPDPVEKPWRKKRFGPRSRRSGPPDAPRKVKKDEEGDEENSEEELHSKRWRLKRRRVLEEAPKKETGEPPEQAPEEGAEQGAEEAEDEQEMETVIFDEDETE